MPAVKSIAECLQALGVLERQLEAQIKTQWPQKAKSLNEAIAGFTDSIEEENHAHGVGESLDKWIEERVAQWVQSNGERWWARDRSMFLPHAPVFPKEEPIIVYWIQQYVLSKLNNAVKNRKKNQVSKSLPGLQSHRGTAARPLSDDSHTASMRDSEQAQASEAGAESHDLDGWDPYQDPEPDAFPQESAAVSAPDPPHISPSISDAVVPYRSPYCYANQDIDPSQNSPSSIPATNDCRSRTYAPVIFEAEMFARTKFLAGPSRTRNGHTTNFYARVMRLEEAQKAETFRAGVLERLGEMGEVVGSKKIGRKA